jgi:hypothetical protein
VRVLSTERFDREVLLASLRRTPLVGYDDVSVYEAADVTLEPAVDTGRFVPPQRYILTGGVAKVLELRDALLEHGIDLFALDGGVYVRTTETPDEIIPVIPPIIEESRERDGTRPLLVADGMHRVYAARSLGLPISVVVVRDIPKDYPYYAYPEPDGWAAVQEFEELPDGFQKKEYRVPSNYHKLFRNYNAVFPGVQAVRKASNPSHLRP